MEPVNFIMTLAPAEQHALRRWYYFSLLMIIGALMVMIGVTTYQMYSLHQLNSQGSTLLPASSMESLRHQEQELQSISEKIGQFGYQNPLPYLVALEENLPEGAILHTLILTKSSLELTLTTPQVQNIGIYRSKLGHIGYFSGITVLSIEPSKGGFLGHMRGSLGGQT